MRRRPEAPRYVPDAKGEVLAGSRRTGNAGGCVAAVPLLLGLVSAPAVAQDPAPGPEPEVEVESDEGLRERLTEREDRRRPLESWTPEIGGHPLTISGGYDLELGYLHRRSLGDERQEHRLALDQELEVELFTTWGTPLSIFAQARVGMEEDLLRNTPDDVSAYYLERGEMWIYSEQILGTPLYVDVGRLDFDDERTWWWDEELDAFRAGLEGESWEVVAAVGTQLFPVRTSDRRVEPDLEDVLFVLGEASLDWATDHGVELFALYRNDNSSNPRLGSTLRSSREDESDARLTWVGARLLGAFDLGRRGILGYWLDAAYVGGSERLTSFADAGERISVVEGSSRRDVRGWGVDGGMVWILPLPFEPRLFGGYAFGSGDREPDSGTDRAFRQTGLHSNDSAFGGVERFPTYGVVLDPELSNLAIATFGVGISLWGASSLDLVYHHYRQPEAAGFLRDARIDADLNGRDHDVGNALDLVLSVEEWERFAFDLVGSGFRRGPAFGADDGTWSYGAFVRVRFSF